MVNKETEWREYEKRDITNLKENRDRNTEKRIKKLWVSEYNKLLFLVAQNSDNVVWRQAKE